MDEETIEDDTEDIKDETLEIPSEDIQETKYTCSLCEALVVPSEVETPTGIRYRCPKCKKFMRPLSKEEVKERREEEEGPLPPTEVMVMERIKDLLRENLTKVYGIPKKESSKRIIAILDTLNPAIAMEPWNLHNHVKIYAPNADDRHLESIINKMFWDLESEGYLPKDERGYQPSYGSRTSGRRRHTRQYPTYGRRPEIATTGRSYPEDPYDEDPYDEGSSSHGRKQPRVIKFVIDGQEIETDFEGFMAYKRFQEEEKKAGRETKVHELRMKELEAKIMKITKEAESVSKKEETLVKIETDDGKEIAVPASMAHLYLKKDDASLEKVAELEKKLDKERDERHAAELKRLEEKIDDKPSLTDQIKSIYSIAPVFGLHQGSKTTLDVIDTGLSNLNARAQQLLPRLPGMGGEFKPEVTRTPDERKQKAEEIQKGLEKTEEILEAEDDFIKTLVTLHD